MCRRNISMRPRVPPPILMLAEGISSLGCVRQQGAVALQRTMAHLVRLLVIHSPNPHPSTVNYST